MKKFNNFAPQTAHDVRRLVVCPACGGMGDKNDMLPPKVEGRGYKHGRCFIGEEGLSAFVKLPREQTDRVTFGDIGMVAMRALMKSRGTK